MAGMLEFGTAGLRGRLGGGPNRMNRAVVIRAAAGLTAYLKTARPRAVRRRRLRRPHQLRRLRARHLRGGRRRWAARAVVLPHPLPTPVLAYAIRHLGADAGVMVTASHNPPEDNGYKVYVGDGSQIVPPVDGLIAAEIAKVGRRSHRCRMPDDGWHTLDDSVLDAYLDDVRTVVLPGQPARGHRRAHRAARRRVRDGAPGVPRGRLRGADPGGVAGRARPDVPDRLLPQPRGAGGDGCRARARRADLTRRRHRQRPGRRPVRRRGARPRRVADAARRRGRVRCSGSHVLSRGAGRRRAARLGRLRLRELDRVVAPARGDVPRRRGCGTRRRSPGSSGSGGCRGCATATRRRSATASTRSGCATRTASRRPCSSPSWWRR